MPEIHSATSPSQSTITRSDPVGHSKELPAGQDSDTKKSKGPSAEEVFKSSKKKYGIVAGSVGVGLSLISIAGVLIKGAAFPSQFLQRLGDAFGSFAAVAAPYFQIKNEIKNCQAANNHQVTKNDQAAEADKKKNALFDDHIKLFYRLCSQGLVPFIFERLLNPENIMKSIFHKIAAVINIPFVAFTGYTWGFGNTQGIIAWGLRKKEEINEHNSKGVQEDDHRLKKESFERIYNSAERMLTIGSIANPVMPCLQYAADGLHAFSNFIKGEQSLSDFFNRPILSFSRLMSTAISIPEAVAKGIDAFMRVVVNERHHLKAVLPEVVNNKFQQWGKSIESTLAEEIEGRRLRKLKNGAEMVFHALSPFAMISLFAPMLDRSHVSEEAQSRGGISAFLDKWIGRYAKTLSLIFTGFYVTFGRLPQGIFQSIYFGRKLIGEYIKGEDKETTQNALIALRQRIYNSPLVSGISNFARNAIEKLVPNFYKVENEYGFPGYNQVLAKNSFDQAQADADYKSLFKVLEIYSIKDNGEIKDNEKSPLEVRKEMIEQIFKEPGFERENEIYKNEKDEENEEKKELKLDLLELKDKIVERDCNTKKCLSDIIVNYCLGYARYECKQGNYDISPADKIEIERLVREKIDFVTKDKDIKEIVEPRCPGALFLVRNFLRPLDFQKRLPEWNHDKLVKLQIYQGDEINSAFKNELEVVGAENADCLRRFVNWVQGIAA